MKIMLTSLLLVAFATAFSQQATQFYFDAKMHPVSKKEASIFGTGETDSGLYKLTCYYMKRKHPLACVARFTDSTQQVHEGLFQYYFGNGILSTEGNYRNGEKEGLWKYYNQEGKIDDSMEFKNGRATIVKGFHYLPGNQLLETIDDVINNELYITLYDAHGNVVSNENASEDYSGLYFNTDKECSFPGGVNGWMQYVSKAIVKHIGDFTDTDYGTVLMRFVVDSSGNISEVRPLNMKYSRLSLIVFNALDAGPKWVPAERGGKKVKTVRIQPVTLQNPDRRG